MRLPYRTIATKRIGACVIFTTMVEGVTVLPPITVKDGFIQRLMEWVAENNIGYYGVDEYLVGGHCVNFYTEDDAILAYMSFS